jgi:Domain of unknown function (DUF4143)
MIETFVLMELARQLTWCSERARLHHHRTKDRVEVDAVLETPDARVVAVEVKTGATVRTQDLAGLRHLAQRLGSRLAAGYVLYTGQQNSFLRRTPSSPSHRRALAYLPDLPISTRGLSPSTRAGSDNCWSPWYPSPA